MTDYSRPVTGYPATAPVATYSYPYAAPPPNSAAFYNPQSLPPPTLFRRLIAATSYNPHPHPHPPPTLLRRLISALLAAFIISLTVFFILWIVLRPRTPQFRADSLSLSSFNLTPSPNSLLTATWLLTLTVRNPNHKLTLVYDHIQASIFYGSESLSVTTLPPFVQPRRNQTVTEARFAAAGSYVDGWVAEGMGKERTEKGSVEFNARLLARVRYKVGAWRARPRFLRVYCRGLQVAISRNGRGGSMTGGPQQCRVGM